MKKMFTPIIPLFLVAGLALTGCSSSSAPEEKNEVTVEVPAEAETTGESFADGVLTTKEVKIEITDYKVIPVGEAGNEYGEKPVIAIWYNTTNLGTSDRDITPSEFIFQFEAFQDNDPNAENKINVGMLPDPAFRDSQTENIKADGTVANAIAYELDDLTTPVELVAGAGFGGDPIGTMTLNLQ